MSIQRFELHPMGAEIATGQGAAIDVKDLKEMAVLFDLTAISGASAEITPWLQGSQDGGSTWFDIVHDAAKLSGAGKAEPSGVASGNRNLGVSIAAVVKAYARYIVFPDQVRAAWVIAGTTPSITFGLYIVGKT